ncbi:LysM peptidoglycan-binding domain-containing protein [Novosphingobium soli]|uniref:LysM peptidoglycan-binding domain-containing protein n=1 Tax=Novosphingobium soli TaxID=574956 RepID=A0ABV6CUX7_9SPHN
MRRTLRLLALGALLAPLPGVAAGPATGPGAGVNPGTDPARETEHVVSEGETLNGIANRAGVSARAVAQANGLAAPYVVRIGQRLRIPRSGPPASAQASVSAAAKAVPRTAAKAPVQTAAGTPSRAPAGVPAVSAASRATVASVAGTAAPAAGKVARTASRLIEARTPPAASATATGTATASTTATPETETEHRVAPGETLGGIALRARVPRVVIAEANGLQPPYGVRAGQTLRIPRTGRYVVRSGDTGFSIAMAQAVPWEDIALANSLDPAAPVKVGQALLIPTLLAAPKPRPNAALTTPRPVAAPAAAPAAARFAWPMEGDVRRGFAATGTYHDGLDIVAPKGTMVRAAAAGTVVFAGEEKDQFGKLVVVDHGEGWHTAYGFLSRVTVKEGARVAAGERVGLVGSTGLAKGTELHFEVRHNGSPVDPRSELPKAP